MLKFLKLLLFYQELCSILNPQQIKQLVPKQRIDNKLIIIDEAYLEFVDAKYFPRLLNYIEASLNAGTLTTLSRKSALSSSYGVERNMISFSLQ